MPGDYWSRRAIRPGDVARLELPFSEVCLHMRVAGRVMDALMTSGKYPMVQLLRPDASDFSAPILPAEAGIYGDVDDGFYYYPPKDEAPAAGWRSPADSDLDADLAESDSDLLGDDAAD